MVPGSRSSHAVIAILSSGFAFLAFGACSAGDGTSQDECGPGQIRTCTNSGFGKDCDCSVVVGAGGAAGAAGTGSIIDGEAGVGGSLGTSGYGGIGGADGAVGSARLGAACTSDADCEDLTCITASSSALRGEGPAKGLCTTSCASDVEICRRFGPKAVCVDFGSDVSPARYCVEGCSFGPMGSAPNPNKCHGREEMACAPLLRSTGLLCSTDTSCALPDHFCGGGQCIDASPVCLPQCNADTDCLAAGLFCNPETGLCRATPSTGLSLGEVCTPPPAGGTNPCRGNCTRVLSSVGTPGENACTESCTIGAERSCGWAGPASGAPAPALCVFSIPIVDQLGGSGAGDRGSCAQLCNCNSDCVHPSFVCLPLPGDLLIATQRQGYCTLRMSDGGIYRCGG
jgi:hypothetical protein